MSRFFGAVLLSAALLVPVGVQAQEGRDDHSHSDTQSKRYYDSTHKDYHQWNSNEDQAYHQYLKENHRADKNWSKASKKDQNAYWNWRHEHSDSH